MEKRLIEYPKNIAPKLNRMNFNNPEKALQCLLLMQMIKILDDILKEKMLNLNEKDKKNYLIYWKMKMKKKTKSWKTKINIK